MAPTRTTLMPLWKQSAGARAGVEWLLYDSYNTDDLTPIADPLTADPGPGLSTVVDTENKFSIAGGWLVCAGGKAAPDFGDPAFGLGSDNAGTPAAYVMAPGYGAFYHVATGTLGTSYLQFAASVSGAGSEPRFVMNGSAARNIQISSTAAGNPVVSQTVEDQFYKYLVVRRSNTHGCHMIIDGKLMWPAEDVLGSPAFVYVSNHSMAGDYSETGLIDLTTYGFTNDFLDVTDTKTNPASSATFNADADCHLNSTFTFETTKEVQYRLRYVDSSNYLRIKARGDGNLAIDIIDAVGGNQALLYVAAFADGVAYEVDAALAGDTLKVFIDKVEVYDSDAGGVFLTQTGGFQYHELVSNDLVLTTHPNPALGIATSRVIAPQTTDAYTHTNDGLFVIKNVTLPSANSLDFQFRISGSDEVTLQLASDGSLLLLDNAATEISAGAATVSDGDDVVLVLEGADGEVFVAGTSAGTTSTIAITTGTAGQRLDATDGVCDYIACFPRSLTSILPPPLYDDTTSGDGPDVWPGTFWNWEDDTAGDATPTGILNQYNNTFTVRDDTAPDYLQIAVGGLDVADYGYTKVVEYPPAGATDQSFDLALPATISTGTHRVEMLIGNASASATQNTHEIRLADGLRADTDDDAILAHIDYNSGTERGRMFEYTGLQGGFASTTLLDTNTVGTYDAQNDFVDWTLVQIEANLDTGSLSFRARNVGPLSVADTGWLTDDGTKFDNEPFTHITIVERNYSGNNAAVAQVWYGSGSDPWPNGILNGWGY